MSNYIAIGVTDEDLIFKAGSEPSGTSPVSLANKLFDLIDSTKLDLELALTDPRVQSFMRQAGIKAEEVRVEKKKREEKKNLLLWGGAAAVIALLALRKKR